MSSLRTQFHYQFGFVIVLYDFLLLQCIVGVENSVCHKVYHFFSKMNFPTVKISTINLIIFNNYFIFESMYNIPF